MNKKSKPNRLTCSDSCWFCDESCECKPLMDFRKKGHIQKAYHEVCDCLCKSPFDNLKEKDNE